MKSFDFNSIEQPTMQITLPNAERTRLTLVFPKTSLVERLRENAGQLHEIFSSKNEHGIHEVYKMFAEIMSCNQQFRTFTADDLKECLSYAHIEAFSLAYMEFLLEVKGAKN